jgi:peptide deformylase
MTAVQWIGHDRAIAREKCFICNNPMRREIIQLGDPLLKTVSTAINPADTNEADRFWRDLETTLREVMKRHRFRTSAGISAVQNW